VAIDLSTTYLGLRLSNPLIASSSPLTGNLDSLRRLEDAGAAAVVLPSLFEEQLPAVMARSEVSSVKPSDNATNNASAAGYRPDSDNDPAGPDAYLQLIHRAKSSLRIPVIASLNGFSLGRWLDFSGQLQQAGADAVELNVYLVPTDSHLSSQDIELHYLSLLQQVVQSTHIPIALKLSPHFSALPNFARQLVANGARGLVLFNRFLEPDIDTQQRTYHPQLLLSYRHELRSVLRWIAILRDQIPCSLGATGGIHQGEDVLKAILAGADATLLASILLRNGPDHLLALSQELVIWMEEHERSSLRQLKGMMSYGNCPDPSVVARHSYTAALQSFIDWRNWLT